MPPKAKHFQIAPEIVQFPKNSLGEKVRTSSGAREVKTLRRLKASSNV